MADCPFAAMSCLLEEGYEVSCPLLTPVNTLPSQKYA